MISLSSIAYQVQTQLASSQSVGRSHILEVLAALLGFGTYAAYRTEAHANGVDVLTEAKYVVLQPEYAQLRCVALGLNQEQVGVLIPAAAKALVAVSADQKPDEPRVFADYEHFRGMVLDEIAVKAVDDSDQLSLAYAVTNAQPSETNPEDFVPLSDLLGSVPEWTVKATGSVYGQQDVEKLYYGHKGRFEADLRFEKVGRVGLRYLDAEVSVDIIDDPSVSFAEIYGE